ncbi:MAG: hypothetical protein Q4P24_14885 [Rhodobacterales bacterium]|nr:hypothetical protein [Rhodobacterales bacterium]
MTALRGHPDRQGYLILAAGVQFCTMLLKTGTPFFDRGYFLFHVFDMPRRSGVVFVSVIQLPEVPV